MVGPSGSGKSTLIAVAAGLERPTAGYVRLLGQDLAKLNEDGRAQAAARPGVAGVPVLPSAAQHDRRGECFRAAGNRRRPAPPATARDWLDRVGLARAPAPTIRISFPAASNSGWPWPARLASRPALLFADEPTGNLDHANAAHVAELIFALAAETGAALVLVTHDEGLAARADRIAAHGRRPDGSPADDLPLSLRFAAREMRAGVRGFRIFLACLALGVAAIAAAGSTAEAFRQGLASRRAKSSAATSPSASSSAQFTPRRTGRLRQLGRVSDAVAAGRWPRRRPATGGWCELRGVNDAYPLAGTVELAGGAVAGSGPGAGGRRRRASRWSSRCSTGST